MKLEIIDAEGEHDPIDEYPGTLVSFDPVSELHLNLRFPNVVVERPGDYQLKFFAGKWLIGQRKLCFEESGH